MTFATRLRTVLDRRGLSPSMAGKACAIAPALIRGYLTSKSEPTAQVLIRLCTGLHCSADELLGLVPAPDPHRDALVASFDRYLSAVVAPVKTENAALRAALIEKRAG